MKLNELTTPLERRRAIVYSTDNKPVRHWYEVRNIAGPYYMGNITEDNWGTYYDLFLFLPGVENGVIVYPSNNMERRDVEWYQEAVEAENVHDKASYIDKLHRDMAENGFIGYAQIEFVKQWSEEEALACARYRAAWNERRRAAEEQRRAEREAREAARKAEEEAKKAAEDKAERDKYLGWADKMTPLRFGKVHIHMDSIIRCDGEYMTRRDFVIARVREGWLPDMEDGETHWYGMGNTVKKSKPRTVYSLRLPGKNLSYTVSKTEYEFAVYIAENMEVA